MQVSANVPEIVQATPADVGDVAPLFDAYRQFYGKPPDEEAARRFLFARLSKAESVLFLARHGARGGWLRASIPGVFVRELDAAVDSERPFCRAGSTQDGRGPGADGACPTARRRHTELTA